MVSLNSPKKACKAVKVEEEAPEDGEEEKWLRLKLMSMMMSKSSLLQIYNKDIIKSWIFF